MTRATGFSIAVSGISIVAAVVLAYSLSNSEKRSNTFRDGLSEYPDHEDVHSGEVLREREDGDVSTSEQTGSSDIERPDEENPRMMMNERISIVSTPELAVDDDYQEYLEARARAESITSRVYLPVIGIQRVFVGSRIVAVDPIAVARLYQDARSSEARFAGTFDLPLFYPCSLSSIDSVRDFSSMEGLIPVHVTSRCEETREVVRSQVSEDGSRYWFEIQLGGGSVQRLTINPASL